MRSIPNRAKISYTILEKQKALHSSTTDFSEAAEPRCLAVSAIKPPDTSRRSEARPR